MAESLGDALAGADAEPDWAEELAAEPLFYFRHDADAASDPKCRRLLRKMGPAGYGMWWMLCEMLASERGHAVACESEDDVENLAVVLDCDPDDVPGFVVLLERLGLVEVVDGMVSSPRMRAEALRLGRYRANGKKGGKAKAEGS